jgi:hypothetical protein
MTLKVKAMNARSPIYSVKMIKETMFLGKNSSHGPGRIVRIFL